MHSKKLRNYSLGKIVFHAKLGFVNIENTIGSYVSEKPAAFIRKDKCILKFDFVDGSIVNGKIKPFFLILHENILLAV